MPKLNEYEGKQLLKKTGVPVPPGRVVSTPAEAAAVAAELDKPVVVKAQVGVTGRFGLGGIKFADDAAGAEAAAKALLGAELKGIRVEKVLVEEKLMVAREFYASVIVNDSHKVKGPTLLFSSRGGTGIEEIAAQHPESIRSINVNILKGFSIEEAEGLASGLELAPGVAKQLAGLIHALYQTFRAYGGRSVEVNPIVVTVDGRVFAADCHFVVDEASVFKYPELNIDYPRDLGREPTELDRIAWEVEREDYRGIGYFAQMALKFEPGQHYIGFHGLGGGGAMLSADALFRSGLRLADYSDTSGNPTASKVYRIAKIILSQPNIDGYALMGPAISNQESWYTALGALRALKEELPCRPGFPVIIFMAGNRYREALEILTEGLKGLDARLEVYGTDYISRIDYVAERMKTLVDEYLRETEARSS